VRWYDKLFEINPAMLATYDANGFDKLYIVRNLAMLGGLATPFGLFNGGELHAKTWTGVAFETAWKAELGGSSPGFALVDTDGRKELAVAVAGSTGKSHEDVNIWKGPAVPYGRSPKGQVPETKQVEAPQGSSDEGKADA